MTARGLERWEKTGAAAGFGAALSLGLALAIAYSASAPLGGPDADFARTLLAERMKWEWVTLARLLGGTLMIWFAATLADRLRAAEGEPSRLGETIFGLGVLWAGVWLLSAFFNSASILLAADYADAPGSRVAAILAREMPSVLTAAIVFTLLLATWVVSARSIAFPRSYAHATGILAAIILLLAFIDWYGPGTPGPWIIVLALLWMAATSVLLFRGRGRTDIGAGTR